MREKSRKNISASDLIQVLQDISKKSLIEKTETGMSYDFDLAIPFLREHDLDTHICFPRPPSRKIIPLNSEKNVYDLYNIVIRNLNIQLAGKFIEDIDADWEPTCYAKWHFEECRFEPKSLNIASVFFPWMGDFRFYKNEFDFGDDGGTRAWLFRFGNNSRVLFQNNDFKNSNIQIGYMLSKVDAQLEEVSWGGKEAHIVKDDSYFEAMIRKSYGFSEAVQIVIPDAYSGHVGLRSISLFGNKGIENLRFRCNAEYYVFRGMNHINSLGFNEFDSNSQNLKPKIYLGSREKIDLNFHNPLHHRNLFLSMKEFASKKQDTRLVNSLDKQLERIEYFLTKEQEVSWRTDGRQWLEYWQDRILYGWRRWSSDFYRSWLRPFLMLVIGYMVLNAFPKCLFESFTISDWAEFSLRPIQKIPFYAETLSELFEDKYNNISRGGKIFLGFIGLFQVVWVAIWGFAFGKSIKR